MNAESPATTPGIAPRSAPPAIEICDVWKSYRTGAIRGRTLLRDFEVFWDRLVRRKNTDAKVLDRGALSAGSMRSNERFWAVQGVSFSVAKGEVVAVLGRNGAGKSTLLQILCRITEADRGLIRIRGKLVSLLGAGVGFNDELTGRENVFLNGSILGMQPSEIEARMASIAEFAEIPEFMDTPVKRYSNGMKSRLGFAVAVHLDADIMILDEVFAAGDRVFRMKSIERMKQLAQSGRTILIVTHMPGLLKGVCERGVVLREGSVIFDGAIDQAVQLYLERPDVSSESGIGEDADTESVDVVSVIGCDLVDADGAPADAFEPNGYWGVRVVFRANRELSGLRVLVSIRTKSHGTLSRFSTLHRDLNTLSKGQRSAVILEVDSLPFDGLDEDYIASVRILCKDGDQPMVLMDERRRFSMLVPVASNRPPVLCKSRWVVDTR